MSERAVSFPYRGEQVFGILHEPERATATKPPLGFVLPHSGSRGRLGCTFHYTFFARELARQGYPVLRFDPPGLGDSSGVIETGPTHDLYGSIQSGRYVGDTLVAIDELRRLATPRRVVLLGICGGAITALAAAAAADDVAGAAVMSIPVMLNHAQQNITDRIPADYARKHLVSLYARKLLSPRAWWRLATRQSDLAAIKPYLAAALRRARGLPPAAASTGTRTNPHFFASARALVERKRRALVVFGEDDRFRFEFDREFYQVHWRGNPTYDALWELRHIKHCNHMLTMREWQQQALQLVLQWLPRVRD